MRDAHVDAGQRSLAAALGDVVPARPDDAQRDPDGVGPKRGRKDGIAMTTPTNPPLPPNTRIWTKPVSADMTAWSISILNDPFDFPMFSETKKVFGSSLVLARIEWHSWTYRNGVKVAGTFRGVTLYEVLSEATSGNVEGIDVSHYQGAIDWRKVAEAGKVFAFIKATEGRGFVDSAFDANWEGARAAGVLRGAYHFFRPGEDALAQAQLFLSKLDSKGDLPPTLDVETASGVSAPAIAAGVAAWVDYVATNYARPLIYASPSFWNALPSVGIETAADLWVAEWNVGAARSIGAWQGWSFWQYSERGAVPGIAGSIDLDRFNGSLDDLHAYLTRSGGASSPAPAFDLEQVRGMQEALNYLGATPPLAVDGIAGRRTTAAIQAFQKAQGLTMDGIAGPKTIAALQIALDTIERAA